METDVRIELDDVALQGILAMPDGAETVVVFAHGSGSSRLSPRNAQVATRLRAGGRVATLLFDLLTEREDRAYSNRFEIGLLTERLVGTCRWLLTTREIGRMPLGLFGASTGAAAALRAAAMLPDQVRTVVSRGGRPELAGESLDRVCVPVLLIVGGADTEVLALNRRALAALACGTKQLHIVPGATHLFEEPGAIEEVADVSAAWFETYLLDGSGQPDTPAVG
jgi:putative phosphoribosyl transferase